MALITSHVLDSVRGCSASGVVVELIHSGPQARQQLIATTTNEEGRISMQLDPATIAADQSYELVFHTAPYIQGVLDAGPAGAGAGNEIISEVVVRMKMPDPDARYHIPLVLSPHSYTIWWSGLTS